jgi:hypothetical protein
MARCRHAGGIDAWRAGLEQSRFPLNLWPRAARAARASARPSRSSRTQRRTWGRGPASVRATPGPARAGGKETSTVSPPSALGRALSTASCALTIASTMDSPRHALAACARRHLASLTTRTERRGQRTARSRPTRYEVPGGGHHGPTTGAAAGFGCVPRGAGTVLGRTQRLVAQPKQGADPAPPNSAKSRRLLRLIRCRQRFCVLVDGQSATWWVDTTARVWSSFRSSSSGGSWQAMVLRWSHRLASAHRRG